MALLGLQAGTQKRLYKARREQCSSSKKFTQWSASATNAYLDKKLSYGRFRAVNEHKQMFTQAWKLFIHSSKETWPHGNVQESYENIDLWFLNAWTWKIKLAFTLGSLQCNPRHDGFPRIKICIGAICQASEHVLPVNKASGYIEVEPGNNVGLHV